MMRLLFSAQIVDDLTCSNPICSKKGYAALYFNCISIFNLYLIFYKPKTIWVVKNENTMFILSRSRSYLSLFLSLSLSDTFGQHPDIVRFYFLWRRGVNLLLSISFLHSLFLSFLFVFSCCSVVVRLLFKLLFTWLVFIPINYRNKPIFIRCLLFNLMFIFKQF